MNRNVGFAGFLLTGALALPETLIASTLSAADFDGDRRADITVFHPASGNWYIMNSLNGSHRVNNWGWSSVLNTPGDYDGDKRTDLAVFDAARCDWFIYRSSDNQSRKMSWNYTGCVPAPADFDGDGKTDPAAFQPVSGTWIILQSSNGQMRWLNWGWNGTIPVPADYDGDGRADLAVYHPSTGNWYILQSGSGTQRMSNWGWSEAAPVPADYDGDRKADPAVFHPASGNWHVMHSKIGPGVRNWGNSQCVPAPADYDGDGAADITVFLPNEGYWFIYETSRRAMRSTQFGWKEARPVVNLPWHIFRGSAPAQPPPSAPPPAQPAPPALTDALDVSAAITLGNHKKVHPKNAQITRDLYSADCESSGVRLSYQTLNWPDNNSGIGDNIDGRVYIFWKEGGNVVGGHFDWKRPGQTYKGFENIQGGYLEGRKPPKGATVWFCIINNAGTERTDVVQSKTPYPL